MANYSLCTGVNFVMTGDAILRAKYHYSSFGKSSLKTGEGRLYLSLTI